MPRPPAAGGRCASATGRGRALCFGYRPREGVFPVWVVPPYGQYKKPLPDKPTGGKKNEFFKELPLDRQQFFQHGIRGRYDL